VSVDESAGAPPVAPVGPGPPAPGPAPAGDDGGAGGGPGEGEATNPLDLLNGRVGGAVLAVVSFWVVALLIPTTGPTGSPGVPVGSWVANLVGTILVVLAVGLPAALWSVTRRRPGTATVDPVGAVVLGLFFLILAAVWWLAAGGIVPFTAETKVALGVGGTALGALAIGLLLFRTMRVAASLPVVVLFIGLVAFPGAKAAVGDLGPTLVTWMGAILGTSAAAEGATQVARVIQRGGVSKAVANANPSSPETATGLRQALLPETNERLPGDLR
jgi:hypothetical protein